MTDAALLLGSTGELLVCGVVVLLVRTPKKEKDAFYTV